MYARAGMYKPTERAICKLQRSVTPSHPRNACTRSRTSSIYFHSLPSPTPVFEGVVSAGEYSYQCAMGACIAWLLHTAHPEPDPAAPSLSVGGRASRWRVPRVHICGHGGAPPCSVPDPGRVACSTEKGSTPLTALRAPTCVDRAAAMSYVCAKRDSHESHQY